jgi:hypothetical protein
MSDKNNNKTTDFFKDFSTGTGLRLWLFFLFSFFFLGYPVPLSIILGLAGGLAGGKVFGWWKSKEGPREIPPEEIEEMEPEERPRVGGLRLAKQERDSRARRRSQNLLTPFGNLLRR